ncbi:reverse transcriptase [Gossypium australe]|uniref:Reverse transcriptase n=1 Tax=Gossypium australe TaxID=47621 RepID=A0A5B6VP27_9ROSI|nr:reverse transcriptase [Gossypium australe]
MVDASINGAILSKSYNDAYEIIERIASNNYPWPTNRAASGRWVAGIHEVDALTSLAAQVYSMSSMLKNITVNGFNGQQLNQFEDISYEYCRDGHFFENCLLNQESKYYMGNLNWNGPQTIQFLHGVINGRTIMTLLCHIDQIIRQNILNKCNNPHQLNLQAYITKNDELIQSQAATLKNLGNQVGQLANELRSRPQGIWPSDTENLKSMAKVHCKIVILQSGKTWEPKDVEVEHKHIVAKGKEEVQLSVETPAPQKLDMVILDEVNCKPVSSDYLTPISDTEKCPQKSFPVKAKIPPLPYPQRFQKQQNDTQLKEIFDDEVTFNYFDAAKSPDIVEECSAFSKMESLACTELELNSLEDPLEHIILEDSPSDDEDKECLA